MSVRVVGSLKQQVAMPILDSAAMMPDDKHNNKPASK
jgi:hypothetical protein